MFAFVLYDSGRDEFFLARDPVSVCSKLSSNYVLLKRYKSHISKVGVIPLYIGYGGDGTTWFSSELKGLQKHCDHIEVTSSQHSVAVQNRNGFVKSLENLQVFPPGHYMFGSSLSKGPVPEPIRLFAQSPKILIRALFFNPVVQIPLSTRFYTEKWITDEDYIPTGRADLMVLRTKFEESVRRHLLAEVAF